MACRNSYTETVLFHSEYGVLAPTQHSRGVERQDCWPWRRNVGLSFPVAHLKIYGTYVRCGHDPKTTLRHRSAGGSAEGSGLLPRRFQGGAGAPDPRRFSPKRPPKQLGAGPLSSGFWSTRVTWPTGTGSPQTTSLIGTSSAPIARVGRRTNLNDPPRCPSPSWTRRICWTRIFSSTVLTRRSLKREIVP